LEVLNIKMIKDWVKRCMMLEVSGIRQRGHPKKKAWWVCVKR